MSRDFYAILGVARNASEAEIRERFLELAREKHPDRFSADERQAAESRFQEITQAFNVLANSASRRQHDLELGKGGSGAQVEVDQQAARVYAKRGINAYREGDFGSAAEAFEQATRHDPENSKHWYHLALAGEKDPRRRSRAIPAIRKACELEPMNPSYLKLAGKLIGRAGDRQEAAKFLRGALRWGADDEEAQRLLRELES
jgi:DnaJ-class molecular chaperone